MDIEKLIQSCGFNATGKCAASELETRPEVRAMCAVDKCHQYGHSWACPPACGGIDEFQARFAQYETCCIAQNWGQLEDSFDIETMDEINEQFQANFHKLNDLVKEQYPGALLLSAGTCDICKQCSYPDAPCRFPDKAIVSMEAAGLVVSEVCTTAGVPYNHGQDTIAYTGCVLV